ncbi:hypothetical protein GA0074692_2908 [Micromonospora pallida]|uniref:Guanylate cyclase domain-containing protein n=1 Tax=Micromonospora pallida TaxID=145854 RepID=A0A1C6SLC6_9ACTN|nr:hypothetical protein [Micromonospora pallida]SCL30344.1 hypothetical protein GA0074692_2908 [Micromonospora pallida]
MNHPERRLLIAVDMERYSRRGNRHQHEAQHAFQQVLHEAASAVGLDRVQWKTQQAGDGELAILPSDVREPLLIGRFVPELNRILRAYNSSRIPEARIRLRVSIHQGLVHLDGANGFPGHAVIEVCRLCEAKPLKQALAQFPDAGVGLIVSSDIYRDVVTEYPEELRPDRFRRVEVRHPDKEFRESAWICVVDEDLRPPRTGGGEDGPDSGPSARRRGPRDPRNPSGSGSGAIHTGDVRVDGANAIGHGTTAIGSVGGDAYLGGSRP